ncbi:MAG: hypothetical protein RLZZ584_2690 [Pseudomonadota bacterium]|jgi:hypothetical protein
MNHHESPPSWTDTLAGLVRLVLVVLAVPAVVVGVVAALAVLAVGAPFLLVRRLVRWARAGHHGEHLQIWSAL